MGAAWTFMTLRLLILLALAASFALGSGPANATPLTFYTDEASWLAAVSNYEVGPYGGDVLETVQLATLTNHGFEYYTATFSTTTETTGFSQLQFPFTQVGFLYDGSLCNGGGPPGCSVTGDSGEVTVAFNFPIYGFGSDAEFIDNGGEEIDLNGEPLPNNITRNDSGYYEGFFGVVGDVSSLDFVCGGFCDITDDTVTMDLSNITLATVDEPSTLPMLLAGLGLIGGLFYFGRKKVMVTYRCTV